MSLPCGKRGEASAELALEQPFVEGIGEALFVGGIEGGRAAGLHPGRAQLFHEITHAETSLYGLAGVDLATGIERLAAGIDHPGGEGDVAGDHQIAGLHLLGNDMIRHIGQGIAKRGAHGFGMNVVYHNRSRLAPALEAECKARYVEKDELLRTADHVVLVLPYTPASHHTMGAAELALMKPTATLINIARGGIVDDAALAVALHERRIAAAGLDVFEGEPTVHPDLLTVPNVVLTPHIASATVPTRLAMANLAADNLIAFFDGRGPLTPVNQPAAMRSA